MGLSWQQGPLSTGAVGRFLVPESLPHRLLYAEPLRRRMRVRFGAHGLPIAKTSSYCSNLAAIRSHTLRRTTYLRTFGTRRAYESSSRPRPHFLVHHSRG